MNIRRFELSVRDGAIHVALAMGLGTIPLRQTLTLTPSDALELSSALEHAVHLHCQPEHQPELPLSQPPNTTTDTAK